MKKLILTGILAASVLAVPFAANAQAVVVGPRVAPPRMRVERRGPPPAPGHVWIAGNWQWNGSAYDWQAGHWEAPPRRRAAWVAPRWAMRHGQWVRVEGHWR